MAEVSPLSGRVSPRRRGPIRPITGRPSRAPPLLYPLRHSLPCGRDTAASQRRDEWGLPCCPMERGAWGGCLLYSPTGHIVTVTDQRTRRSDPFALLAPACR